MLPTYRKIIVAALALLAAGGVCAGPGDLDTEFGVRGRLELRGAFVPLPDGSFRTIEYGDGRWQVRHFDVAGKPAPLRDFSVVRPDSATFYDFYGQAIATRDGGLLMPIMVPDPTLPAGFGRSALLRARSDGSPDPSFGSNGRGYVLIEDPDASTRTAGKPDMRIIYGLIEGADGAITVLEADDYYPNSWGPDGPWGKVGGDHGYVGPCLGCELDRQPLYSVTRLLPDGRLDTRFGTNGRVKLPKGSASLFRGRADGSILLARTDDTLPGVFITTISADGHTVRSVSVPGMQDSGEALMSLDGGLVVVGAATNASGTPIGVTIARATPDLQFDMGLGAGTGAARIDIGQAVTGRADNRVHYYAATLSPDGSAAYLWVQVYSPGDYSCTGVTRLKLSGTPGIDDTFGKNGFACFTTTSGPFGVNVPLVAQSGGGLLLQTGDFSPVEGHSKLHLWRMHTGNFRGAGMVTFTERGSQVYEGAGEATVKVSRVTGSLGPLSVTWRTGLNGHGPEATADVDYRSASGRLDWADGDMSDRTIRIPVIDDSLQEDAEFFAIFLEGIVGDEVLGDSDIQVAIGESDRPSPVTPPVTVVSSGSIAAQPPAAYTPAGSPVPGGGGALGLWGLLAMLALLARRLRAMPAAC